MQYYLFLIGATLLYSVQFVFLKYFQKIRGTGLAASMAFSACSAAVLFAVLFCANGLRIAFSPFSLGVAALYAAAMIGMNAAGIKSLGYVSLSLYTLFSMLGGMLLPVLYGVCTGETMTWLKGAGAVLIVFALLIAVRETGKPGPIGAACCAGVFLLNGCFGIFTKWHQSSPLAVPTLDFLLLYSALTVAASALLLPAIAAYGRRKTWRLPPSAAAAESAEKLCDEPENAQNGPNMPREEPIGRGGARIQDGRATTRKENALSWMSAAGYAAVNGGAQLIVMLCAKHVDASVQYPIITGGCVLFSVLTGLLFGEKATPRAILRAALALTGTLLFMF